MSVTSFWTITVGSTIHTFRVCRPGTGRSWWVVITMTLSEICRSHAPFIAVASAPVVPVMCTLCGG